MNIELKEWHWVRWNGDLSVVTIGGTVDFVEPVGVGFGVTDLSELFGVPRDSEMLYEAFAKNREYLEKIAKVWIQAGRLDDDGSAYLTKKDLLPYFKKRAATAPA